MKPGAGRGKGQSWERECCRTFSLWISDGRDRDIFWRTASSGGRFKKTCVPQAAGDMCAIKEEGFPLTNLFSFEFKSWGKLDLFNLIDQPSKGKSKTSSQIEGFWDQCIEDAKAAGKIPWLVFKRNNFKPYMAIPLECFESYWRDIGTKNLIRHVRWADHAQAKLILVCGFESFLKEVDPKKWIEKLNDSYSKDQKLSKPQRLRG